MKVSVIIPFYNELSLLPRAVSSVLNQNVDCVEFEIFIINDGPMIIEDISKVVPVLSFINIVHNFHATGPGGARNTGLDLCTGDYIAFLDADDFWDHNKLRLQLNILSAGASFVCAGYRFEQSNVVVLPPMKFRNSLDIFIKQGIGTSTVVISKQLLGSCRFNNYRFSQDIDFWYRLSKSDLFNFGCVNSVLSTYFEGGSTKNKFVQVKSFVNILNKNNLPLVVKVLILFKYSFRGIINHFIKRFC